MQFKMAENSLFAILMRSQWWISLLIVLGVVGISFSLLPREYSLVGAFGAFPFVVTGFIAGRRRLNQPSASKVAELDGRLRVMSWTEFSQALARGWERDGYEVIAVGRPGADFKLRKGGRLAVVSCKRWKAARTGVEPLKELADQAAREDADDSIYLSIGEMSQSAIEFAAARRIRLMAAPQMLPLFA